MSIISVAVSHAMAAAKRANAAGTLTIARPEVPDGLTGAIGADLGTYSVTAIVDKSLISRAEPGTDWSSASVGLLVAADDCPFAPKIGDRATWGGVTLPIVARDVTAPTGTPVAYLLGLGA